MVVLVVKFEVKEGKKEEFLNVMDALVTGTRKEPGNIQYDLNSDVENSNKFVLFEKFEDQAALDFHNQAEHFVTYAPKLGDLCENISVDRCTPVN